MKRPIYRKWHNPYGEYPENYLMIHPNGLMLQISFTKDHFGDKILIYQTNSLNGLNATVFKNHKDVCLKSEWSQVARKAINYVKGAMLTKKQK